MSDSNPPSSTPADAEGRRALTASGRPRVLDVRFGVNPNSSSLGVDVTYLLFGGTGAVAVGLALSVWLRALRRRPELVGTDASGTEL